MVCWWLMTRRHPETSKPMDGTPRPSSHTEVVPGLTGSSCCSDVHIRGSFSYSMVWNVVKAWRLWVTVVPLLGSCGFTCNGANPPAFMFRFYREQFYGLNHRMSLRYEHRSDSSWTLGGWLSITSMFWSIIPYEGGRRSVEDQVRGVVTKVNFSILLQWTRTTVLCVSEKDKAVLRD